MTGHDSVAGDLGRLDAEVRAAVGHELVHLDEAARVEEHLDALSGGHPAALVLARDPGLAAAHLGLCVQLL